jgi:hypothetical protein
MDHDVGPMGDRLQTEHCRDCIVNDERYTEAVGYFSDRFYVYDVTSRVTDAFTEDGFCVVVNQLCEGLGSVIGSKPDLDAFVGKDLHKIRIGDPVKFGGTDTTFEPISVTLRVQ